MQLYKLTEQDKTTYYGSTLWGNGVTHTRPRKENPRLCSSDVIHAYANINLAFLLNQHHANIISPLLWSATGEVAVKDYGKVGCFELTTTEQLSIPVWVTSGKARLVQVAFAMLCAETVLKHFEAFYPGDQRPRKAIEAAKAYLENPSYAADAAAAAAYAAAYDAAAAADAAAYAARAAAYAARAAAADAAAYAARAAAYAARAAAAAADAYAADGIDYGPLADKAVALICNI